MIIKIKIEMFDTIVKIATDEESINKLLKQMKHPKYKVFKDLDGLLGCAFDQGGHQYVYILKPRLDVLVHELLHVVKAVTRYRGVDDEETECYMLDHLVAEATKKIKLNIGDKK